MEQDFIIFCFVCMAKKSDMRIESYLKINLSGTVCKKMEITRSEYLRQYSMTEIIAVKEYCYCKFLEDTEMNLSSHLFTHLG